MQEIGNCPPIGCTSVDCQRGQRLIEGSENT
jgi:hypothetical protein